MKVLLREFWGSWHTWLFLGSLAAACGAMAWLALWSQRMDYQRRLDLARIQSVADIEKQIVKLREADQKSAMDRTKIKQEVEEIKEDIQGVPPLFMRAGKTTKKAVDQFKGQGVNP